MVQTGNALSLTGQHRRQSPRHPYQSPRQPHNRERNPENGVIRSRRMGNRTRVGLDEGRQNQMSFKSKGFPD